MMRPQTFKRASRIHMILATFVALMFVCLLPFAGALEVHHIFAEIDHDGHEHSDFDLCQWMQAHGNGSLDIDLSNVGCPIDVAQEHWRPSETVLASIDFSSQESRGPPFFL